MQRKQNNFRAKYDNQNNIRKVEWINNMGKKLEGLEEGLKGENSYQFTQNNTKKIANWKTPGYDGIHRFWFQKSTSIHERLAIKINRGQQVADLHDGMTKEKTMSIQKDPLKGTVSKKLQSHNVPTFDVENTDSRKREEI